MKSSFFSFKSVFPSFYSSTAKSVSNIISSLTMSESEYLHKTEATEKEIVNFLTSKMEMEVILGLKIVLMDLQNGKDVTCFIPRIFEIVATNTSYYAKRLCLAIIDDITLTKRSDVLMLYNTIAKSANVPDVLIRLCIIKILNSLKGQDIASEAIKTLITFTQDSNPLLRRIALVVIVAYIKANKPKEIISQEAFIDIVKKFISDSNPVVYSAGLYAVTELSNSDYLSIDFHCNFSKILSNLNKIDDYYFERTVFVIVNFVKVYLMSNVEANSKYIIEAFNAIYLSLKRSTSYIKNTTALCGLHQMLSDIGNANNEKLKVTLLKENSKRIRKIVNMIIKLILQSQNEIEKIISLDIAYNFISKDANSIFYLFKKEFENQSVLAHFFIYSDELNYNYITQRKFNILTLLASEITISSLISEFKRISNFSASPSFKKNFINAIYRICTEKNQSTIIVESCIERLIEMLKIKDDILLSEVIICLSQLISQIQEQKKYVLVYSIKSYKNNITNPIAKANIISMIAKNLSVIPTVSVDFFRRLIIQIESESDAVKLQILTFALEIHQNKKQIMEKFKNDVEIEKKINLLIHYVVNKLNGDENYNIREKARIIKIAIENDVNILDIEIKEKKEVIENENKENLNNNNKDNYFLEVIANNSEEHIFKFDKLSEENKSKMKLISLDDLIKVSTLQNEDKKEQISPQLSDTEKYSSCKPQSSNVSNEVSNINASIDVEQKKKMLKNQLDEFLNNEDDDEEDFQVEIKKG